MHLFLRYIFHVLNINYASYQKSVSGVFIELKFCSSPPGGNCVERRLL